ncbi:hypothetical protein [Clavibacter michiganensis]|uniref:hypothetical protein n=1 Tax=Clavibacter michiganensis TaxID=28447 RepID=UPI0005BC34F3|nr:hypothetical protein [Clavibacter michiganensis]
MIDALQDFTNGLPELLRWFGIMVTAMIPFLEVEFGAVVGVISGQHVAVAVLAAIVGNVAIVALIVLIASRARTRLTRDSVKEETPRRAKVRRTFDRYGVPGVSLLGPLLLPTHFTSAAMVSFGACPRAVLIWETLAIAVWGVAFGALAVLGLAAV